MCPSTDPFRPVSSEITLGKWEQMRMNLGLRKGSHSAPIMCASLRESSGPNTSHPVSLFFFFFVLSIQRNMAEMCNYLFEALCFQQVWNMCTSSPLLFLFISVRLLFLNPPSSPFFLNPFFSQLSSSRSHICVPVTHCFSLLPLIFLLSSFLASHTHAYVSSPSLKWFISFLPPAKITTAY